MKTTLVTTTRDRALCFSILEKWAARTKFDQWLVVNDGTEPYKYTMGQEVIIRKPGKNEAPHESILLNWLTALPRIQGDVCLVYEDDDYYQEGSGALLTSALEEVDLVGFNWDLYYKLPSRRFFRPGNVEHASLGASGFRRSVFPVVEKIIKEECTFNRSVFIDMYLWHVAEQQYGLTQRLLPNMENPANHVGFKFMPGAAGLGIGHKGLYEGMKDFDFAFLTKWLGREDSQVYKTLWKKIKRP